MTLPVFLVSAVEVDGQSVPLSEVSVGETLRFEGPEADHARRSMRVRKHDELELSDTSGLRLRVRVTETEAQGLRAEATARRQEEPPPIRFTLVQALAKAGRDEMAVEAATELGVDRVVPWQAARSVSKWSETKAPRNQQKWRHLVRAATKQARRAFVPQVEDLMDSQQLARFVAGVSGEGGLVLICDEEAEAPLAEVVATALSSPEDPAGSQRDVVVIVGPEGGISPAEKRDLAGAGGLPIVLGPNVLRTSTAGPVALALLSYLVGRWETGSQGPQ